ncbi:hypothetical protein PR202_ga29226 [Eleusine coracana subsp. coracana]|uniref:Uncharacterized protein n=1 Tax=Eleusine coracana subsp. coracana TaxID=191504 RepID=A0AAV5DL42_ELECO|nr:hypothetical protein PR202_ga29226 [Eleusine coracana subsp. coracana]
MHISVWSSVSNALMSSLDLARTPLETLEQTVWDWSTSSRSFSTRPTRVAPSRPTRQSLLPPLLSRASPHASAAAPAPHSSNSRRRRRQILTASLVIFGKPIE